jgi:hypothetical protein
VDVFPVAITTFLMMSLASHTNAFNPSSEIAEDDGELNLAFVPTPLLAPDTPYDPARRVCIGIAPNVIFSTTWSYEPVIIKKSMGENFPAGHV